VKRSKDFSGASRQMPDMLFISHANPEDNEFSRWLALQLAKQGYPVWCDLTKLLGGEDFWKDVEHAIRERTAKFLFVLSRTSNVKDGPLRELHLAQIVARQRNLSSFVIPLHIDDLPHSDVNIQVSRIISIPFHKRWADGLRDLLDKLEDEQVKKSPRFSVGAVASWWKTQFSAEEGVINKRELYLSNWFLIQDMPADIHFHTLKKSGIGLFEVPKDLPYAGRQHNVYLISFACKDDFEGKLGKNMSITDTHTFSVEKFLGQGVEGTHMGGKDARNIVSSLLRVGWENLLSNRGLPTFSLADKTSVFYFSKGFVADDTIHFLGVDGRKTYRSVVGYRKFGAGKGVETRQRFWHFGVRAKPIVYPATAFIIKCHVVFSDDGYTPWSDKKRMHNARRSQCKNWWNPEWRDRLLATLSWLSDENGGIRIELGRGITIRVPNLPVTFHSPVSFLDPEKVERLDHYETRDVDEELDEFEDLGEGDDFEESEEEES
jgi:hypothetical protein